MGGGFMADNKGMTMQQQAITTKQQKKKPLLQQQQDLPRHSHQAFPPSNLNPKLTTFSVSPSPSPSLSPSPSPASSSLSLKRKTPDPLPSTSSPPPSTSCSLPSKPHKKKFLKVILKVPHSSPSSSSPSSSPLSPPPFSRPSPRSPHPTRLSPAASPSPSPSAALLPSLPLPLSSQTHSHPHQRQKFTAELSQFNHHQQSRPSKPPLLPSQQIKHPPVDPKLHHHVHKKSHHLNRGHQKGDHLSPNLSSEQLSNPSRKPNQEQNPSNSSQTKLQQGEFSLASSNVRHRENLPFSRVKLLEHGNRADISQAREIAHESKVNSIPAIRLDQTVCTEQAGRAHPSRIKHAEHDNDAKYIGVRRTDKADRANQYRTRHLEQLDQADSSLSIWSEPVDQANPNLSKRTEQVDESSHRRSKQGGAGDQAHLREVDLTEEIDLIPSRSKRPEAQQLDVEAIPERSQRHHELQEGLHAGSYPKRLRTLPQSQQEPTYCELGSQHHRLPQGSSQQQADKKLTQVPVQGAHCLHQSSRIPPSLPIESSSPHPLLPSTSASLQSSGPSLSTSALSDEAQKPSKKRKLRSLLEPEFLHGHSATERSSEEPGHNASSTPVTTPASSSPVVKPRREILEFKERAASSSSPKAVLHAQLVPARNLLRGILDRLQKKDRFGVFAEPVDKNEVPNYYDIIEDPMDFGTMRNRIESGHYTALDLFQRDVFLICDNAMNYNGKGTVYFRHARAIKDIAERILEDLKVTGVSMETDEPVARQKNGGSGRLPERNDSFTNMGSPSETRADNADDFSGYLLRTAGVADGRRFNAVDENRRGTYVPISTPFQSNDPLLTTISGDSLHLVPTGYQMDFPYAKSLARFAAELGPSVWKVASEKIRRALPPGYPFGPGWVGEQENPGGIVIAPSTKQQLQGQPGAQVTSKSSIENGPATTSIPGNSLVDHRKLHEHLHSQVMPSQEGHGSVTKLDNPSGIQARMQAAGKPPNEVRSPMVFGNSLGHNERLSKLDQQAHNQPAAELMTRSHNSESNRQGSSPVDQENPAKFDQVSVGARAKSKFAAQVNLNHPLSFHSDEGFMVENRVLNLDSSMKSKEDREGRVNVFLPVSNNAVMPATSAGGGLFDGFSSKGSAHSSRVLERVNVVKDAYGEAGLTGLNISARKQLESRPSAHFSRLNSLNQSPNEEASPNATTSGNSNALSHYESLHSARGSLHNLNLPVQQTVSNSGVALQDVNVNDSMRPNSAKTRLTQGFALPRNLNTPVQHSSSNSQQPTFSNHVRSRDTSPAETGLPKQALHFPEQAVGERFREAGEFREKEMPSPVCSTPTGMPPKKGFGHEKTHMMQQPETRNGQSVCHDLGSTSIQNLDQLSRRQNASVGLSVSGFPVGLPTSNGAFKVREDSRLLGWVPAQQPDSSSEKIGMKMHNQIMRSAAEQQEGIPGNVTKPQDMRLASMQLQEGQNPQVFGYGNQKVLSSVPHFLQQQLGRNAHLSIQHQQVQLHMQNNALKPVSQNSSPTESLDSKFTRQFQVPSQRVAGSVQVGRLGWQSTTPQMISQGPHPSFTAAPDLNVSLPLSKSPFDQPNGNDIQQPDLALQL